jgi:hypothetical protein
MQAHLARKEAMKEKNMKKRRDAFISGTFHLFTSLAVVPPHTLLCSEQTQNDRSVSERPPLSRALYCIRDCSPH